MIPPDEEGAARSPAPSPSSSAKVQLEVDVLAADLAAEQSKTQLQDASTHALRVLVVASQPDVRAYISECLRSRTNLLVLEAASVQAAIALAQQQPRLLIVDESEIEVIGRLPQIATILIVDDASESYQHGTRADLRVLARPFNTRGLLQQVDSLLGNVGGSR